jgi:hypothetical protein
MSFAFPLPVLVIVDQAMMEQSGLPAEALQFFDYAEMGEVLPVFTERVLAGLFLIETGMRGAGIQEVASGSEFLSLATTARDRGITHAAVDIIRREAQSFALLQNIIDLFSHNPAK